VCTKCHVCNSVYNDSCVVIDTNQYLTDCMKINHDTKRNYTICRKESFSVSSTEFQMTTSRTIRTCGYEKHPKFDCFYNSNHDIKEKPFVNAQKTDVTQAAICNSCCTT
ncbi:hypothetical protein JTE90_008371, partial [Oedothorax gibbosus]